ncbi:MAG: hypothetical protein WB992_00905 [Bryobacteraceae bacterium]
MVQLTYEKEITGLVLMDPYNDFISEGGKLWDRIKGVAEGNQCVPHMQQVLEAARKTAIRVFYAMHRDIVVATTRPGSTSRPFRKQGGRGSRSNTAPGAVKDATASYSDEQMHAALEVNIPNYASAIVTTKEIVGAIASLSGASLVDESIPAI